MSVVVSASTSHSSNESIKAINYAISMQQLHGLTILILLNSKLSFILGKSLTLLNYFFSAGLLLFCFNIYMAKLINISIFSFLTPFGGGSFLIGWLLFMTLIFIRILK